MPECEHCLSDLPYDKYGRSFHRRVEEGILVVCKRGPIERELRADPGSIAGAAAAVFWLAHDDMIRRGYDFPLKADIMSEAIEAAAELGL